mmetsp:Transcript_35748/g.40181  ORF Transcript_35748/g.40181 Transcript_35748/m.40181 type:complete len:80 (+) Transcript_35748:98-337(+)
MKITAGFLLLFLQWQVVNGLLLRQQIVRTGSQLPSASSSSSFVSVSASASLHPHPSAQEMANNCKLAISPHTRIAASNG